MYKYYLFAYFLGLLFLSNNILAQNLNLNCPNTDPTITSWIISDGVSTMRYYDDIADEASCTPNIVTTAVEANVQSVRYNGNYVWVEATGCPDYMCGPFNGDGNPNFPGNQNRTIVIPRTPIPNPGSSTNGHTDLGAMGYLVNGVAIFNAGDGMSFQNAGVWNRNAVVRENEGFGCDRSHPAGTNLHNHQIPMVFNYAAAATQSDVCDCFPSVGLFTVNPTQHSPLVGFAIDGFPIYGPYAYANADGTGGIALMTPSYQKRNITTRTTYADGTAVTPGPNVNMNWPLGSFYEDYEFIANSGTLDYYNGRFAVTPEYPCGTYAYYTTMDVNGDALFPYIVGLEFYGEVVSCGGGGTGGGPPVVACNATPPPPPGAPCCGDGVCNGSEDATTCPGDCSGSAAAPPCTPPAGATLYASSGTTPTCTSTVNAGADIALSCATGMATLTGAGVPGGDASGLGSMTYEWCTNNGNITAGTTSTNATVNMPGTYIFYVTDGNNYTAFDIVEVAPACSAILTVKAFLQGPYDTGTGMMNDDLQSASLIPTTDPYGLGTTTTTAILTAGTGGDVIVDWVLVELRDSGNPSTVAAQTAALIQRDGDIISATGESPLSITAPMAGNYHVVVRHRNHLGVMSNSTVTVN